MLSGLRVAARGGSVPQLQILGSCKQRWGLAWVTIGHQGPRPAFGQQLEAEVSQELGRALEGNPMPAPSQGAVECDIGSPLVCLAPGSESLEMEPCLWEHHQLSWEMQRLFPACSLVTLVLALEESPIWASM